MQPLHSLIALLTKIEIALIRRKAAKQATQAAVRMALNGCR